MLKATRYALFREVARTGNSLVGVNLTALYTFISALAEVYTLKNFCHLSEHIVYLFLFRTESKMLIAE